MSALEPLPPPPLTSLGKVATTRTLLVMRFSGQSDLEKSKHPELSLRKANTPCTELPPCREASSPCGASLGDAEGP